MNNYTQSSNPWIICPKPNPNAQLRLFCFHHAGGGTLSFRNWDIELSPIVETYLIQLPGRERRLSEPALTRIEPLVRELKNAILPYLKQPFAFFGYSMGSLVAFELTRCLRRDEQLYPKHLFMCARRAPQLPKIKRPIHQLPDAEFMEELYRLNGTPKEILANDELMKLLLPTLRADFATIETYDYYDEAPLKSPITAFGGSEDTEVSRQDLEAWKLQTNASFELHILPGDHFFINSARSRLIQILSRECSQITKTLDK